VNPNIPPREAFLKMKQAALKALEKDNTLGEAHRNWLWPGSIMI